MNGAQALLKTLADACVEVCFTNPGTSEMHFVAALDGEPRMRAVLALFEGVATGAADGYARMAGKPAATLLHLGCGLGNGLANLHNARKGKVPVLNIVGDHATFHTRCSGARVALLLGGQVLREPGLLAAARIAGQAGVRLLAEVFPARLTRGAGLPAVERIAYLAEMAGVQLADLEHLILVDAKAPVSFFAYPGKQSGPRHDLITLTGGAIGQGLPNAVGAAIACPGRPVIALIGDGTAMYTIQALWTMAREGLHAVSIVFNNASYSVLNVELERVGAGNGGAKARAQLDLDGPRLNFAQLAQGMGVHAVRTQDAEEFCQALEYALAMPGPHLIEALVPEALSGARRKLLPWLLRSLPGLPRPVALALKRKLAP